MSDHAEAVGRMQIAADQYRDWDTADLWDVFVLLTDDAWQHGGNEPEPKAWAAREAIGLALIDRGATVADLTRGFPYGHH